ncbi:hypothetical protein D3C77_517520 [compost metagenome]
MGRWREMSQQEVDILAAEVGLTPVSMPVLNHKSKDKLERLQRKSTRPLGRGERVRTLRPAQDGAAAAERPARQPRGGEAERPARQPRGAEAERPARQPRGEAPRKDTGRGRSTVAERPSEMNKRGKPAPKRPGSTRNKPRP